jgi:hypothetical protein
MGTTVCSGFEEGVEPAEALSETRASIAGAAIGIQGERGEQRCQNVLCTLTFPCLVSQNGPGVRLGHRAPKPCVPRHLDCSVSYSHSDQVVAPGQVQV